MYSILLLAVAVKPACDYIIKQITKNIKQDRNRAYDELAEKLSKQTNDDQTITNKKLESFAEKLSSAYSAADSKRLQKDDLSCSRKEIYNVESYQIALIKLAESLNEQADNNVKTLESSMNVLLELAEKLNKQTNDLSNSLCYNTTLSLETLECLNKTKEQSHLPSSEEFIRAIELNGVKEVQLLCKNVAEVRKLVLESSCKTIENIDQVKSNLSEHTNNVKTHIDDRIEKVGKQVMDSRTAGQLDAANIRSKLLENRTAAHADAISLHDEHVQMHKKSSRTASLI